MIPEHNILLSLRTRQFAFGILRLPLAETGNKLTLLQIIGKYYYFNIYAGLVFPFINIQKIKR